MGIIGAAIWLIGVINLLTPLDGEAQRAYDTGHLCRGKKYGHEGAAGDDLQMEELRV